MWHNYLDALKLYHNLSIFVWKERGFKNNMVLYDISKEVEMPCWLGWEKFHSSHRSNLLRKDPIHYGRYGWNEPNNLEYVWPQ